MWIAIDIETYEKYDGTKKSSEKIKSQMITDDDRDCFEKGKIKNKYYPVLNSRKFFLGCAYTDENKKYSFLSRKEMLNWIIKRIEINAKKGERTYFFGHNIEYDLYGIIKDDIFKLLSSNLEIISEGPFLGTWRINKKNWGFFVDSFSFFRKMSVAVIGEIIGFNKLKMPECVDGPEELMQYCMRDCEIVLKGMKFLKENLGVLGFAPRKFLTAGQVAISTFMSYIRKEGIHWNIMKSGEVYKGPNLERCRPAFRGARNEAFKIGKIKDVVLVDVNSLYPYAMTKMPFPKLDEEMFVNDPLEKGLTLKEVLDERFIGCVECDVIVPKLNLGYLPVRFGGVMQFPGEGKVLKGTWTTLELREAKKLGYKIFNLNWCCLYPVNKINVFESYINKLYELRKNSDGVMKIAIKLIMNNLYGKFAQFRQNKEYKVIYRGEFTRYKEEDWKVKSVWGNKYVIEKYKGNYVPKYTNLIISILVTAYGRDFLYKYLSKISSEDLVYCDTDGIIMKNWKKYKDQFKVSEELGDWKVEEIKGKNEAIIKGEKDYKIGNEVKISGVSKRVLQNIDFEKIESVKQKRRVGIKDVLRSPGEFLNQFGSFRDFEIKFKIGKKSDQELPKIIDERKEWVNIFD